MAAPKASARARATRSRSTSSSMTSAIAESGGRYGEPAPVEIETKEIGDVKEPINIVLFGPSGIGKTRLAAGVPRGTFLTTEQGVISAKHTGSTAKVWQAPTWAHCFAGIRKAEAELKEGDWLIVDSATKMQQLQLQWILETQAEQSARRDIDLPEVQDHQKWQNQFVRFIDRIYKMPCNTITIATAMLREDSEGDNEWLPELRGGETWRAISHYMCSQAGVVLYFNISREKDDDDKPKRWLQAQPYPPYTAKDRYNVMGFGQWVYHDDHKAMAEFVSWMEEAS